MAERGLVAKEAAPEDGRGAYVDAHPCRSPRHRGRRPGARRAGASAAVRRTHRSAGAHPRGIASSVVRRLDEPLSCLFVCVSLFFSFLFISLSFFSFLFSLALTSRFFSGRGNSRLLFFVLCSWQGPAAGRLLPVGLRVQRARPRVLPRPRPGRPRAHRRRRQRGEGPRHPDGVARQRPARLLPLASSTRSTTTSASSSTAAPPSPRPSSRTRRPPSATWTASARSPAPWPCAPPPWARTGSYRIVHQIISESLDAAGSRE